ncbi:tripartite tricarboxylate transporter substrate binding protein [Bordetella bronchiseptica]|uniref:tripartite tricarboxylate transporter substrate binding protein n=1 Tax=Bordetella bronchiseptica TaxID=518 RepID=UPI00028FAA39|nr:tripartite tricarboxylate transporter substrate binding protein [Bordetella bronchiseptica]KAK72513.1 tripartite tricarboxylate transporter family receptor [Bordetella bronchiseptica MO211]CCN17739.1 putative exported protein [Bordetella bronchiseptica MO211]
MTVISRYLLGAFGRKARLACASAMLGAALLPAGAASADTYPSKPVRLIVPYTPGGATDMVARIVAQHLGARLGQSVIVENKPGAGGNIGSQMVASALPDGYTLLFSTTANAINESLYKDLPFDFKQAFEPVTQLVELPNVVITGPDVPVNSIAQVIALAKKDPKALTYASAGTGTSTHLATELFKTMAGVNILHVPYKGSAPAMTDLRGGRVQLMFDNIPSALPQVQAGAVRALAVTSSRRSPVLPDVPTVAEAGVPGYEAVAWHGISVPAKTPAPIVERLSGEIAQLLKQPEVVKQLTAIGATPVGSTPAQFQAHIDKELAKWQKVVAESGASLN